MVNKIPNSETLTNKYGLLRSLNDYSRSMSFNNRLIKLDFIPESYGLEDYKERDKFLSVYKGK